MDARNFYREKMLWLNALAIECDLKPTTFRVAYIIADHFNWVSGLGWPSRGRLAEKTCLSSKSISRAIKQLEERGWLKVNRKRERSNQYRLAWPPGRKPSSKLGGAADISVPKSGQNRPQERAGNVPQTYLNNLPKTYSSGLGGGKGRRWRDRGSYEQRIADRFGPKVWSLLGDLQQFSPDMVDELCDLERAGELTIDHIQNVALFLKQYVQKQTTSAETKP
jgi:hypothetical protein